MENGLSDLYLSYFIILPFFLQEGTSFCFLFCRMKFFSPLFLLIFPSFFHR